MYQMLHENVSVSFDTLTSIISYAINSVSFYTLPMMYHLLQHHVSEFSTGFSTGCGKLLDCGGYMRVYHMYLTIS